METVIPTTEIESELPETAIEEDSHEPKQELSVEIKRLWSAYNQAEATGKKTKEELRVIRLDLGRRLLEVRTLVSRPGRGGGFSAYVAAHSIPRATAQELIARYKKTLEPQRNCLNQTIPETAKPTAEELATSVWPSLKKILTPGEAVVQFITSVVIASGVAHERRQEGLMIFNPVPEAADEVPGSDAAPDMASQPSIEAVDNTGELSPETATAAPVVEAVAGDGESGEVI